MYISCAGPIKYAISPNMSFGSPGIDFSSILAAFWVSGGAQNEEKSVPGGGRKKRRFSRALFFRLWLILGPLEGPKPRPPLPLFRSFSDPGGYFFCSGLIFAYFDGFLRFWTYLLLNFHDFLTLFFANTVAFSEAIFCHESPRFCQKPSKF